MLPVALAAMLAVSEYRAWALVFGLAAFIGYLDLGIPTSVQALVARAEAAGSVQGMARAASAGIFLVALLSTATVAIALTASAFFDQLFPSVPSALRGAAGVVLVILVVGQVSNLLGNVAAAFFAGQQRAKISALVLMPARVTALALALTAAAFGFGLDVIASAFALPLVVGAMVMLVMVGYDIRLDLKNVALRVFWRDTMGLVAYSGPLMLWSFCVLLTSGAGVVIVGRVDYANVAIYSFGTVIASALIGFQSAVSGPLLPEFAGRWIARRYTSFSGMLSTATALNGAALFGLAGIATASLPLLLSGFLAIRETGDSWIVIGLVLVGNVIHLLGGPLSIAFIASGRHMRIVMPPVVEALLSVSLSVALGLIFGAVGVAAAELVAALAGLLLGFSWSIRRSGLRMVSGLRLAKIGLLRPATSFLPFTLACAAQVVVPDSWVGAAAAGFFTCAGCALMLSFGVPRSTLVAMSRRLRSRSS